MKKIHFVKNFEPWVGSGRVFETDRHFLAGISDLVVDNHKIGGSCLKQSKDFACFSSLILISADLGMMGDCLKHPPREPEQRKGRSYVSKKSNMRKELKKMKSQQVCPTCKGEKFIAGNCECNAEWRSMDSENGVDDCRCEPDIECPDCHGKGYIE